MAEKCSKFAGGGWFKAVETLRCKLQIPMWEPDANTKISELKRSLQRYRREVVTPAVVAEAGPPPNASLPWLWLATRAFPRLVKAFEVWWQIRILGQTFPATMCPWCDTTPMTQLHLCNECRHMALICQGWRTHAKKLLDFPSDALSFELALEVCNELASSLRAQA